MLDIYICVGSSCHLKGSYEVIKIFQHLIKDNGLEQAVSLNASFCLGNCTEGVAAIIAGENVNNLTASNAKEIFNEKVLGRIKYERD
ncbi:MAG: (2Fe-2S) ferredoxin domain-containing protein [Clostridia bacterium]|nr:(2Fe-2S) ferredoxin domain-containing protein [Clostridia bacterium]